MYIACKDKGVDIWNVEQGRVLFSLEIGSGARLLRVSMEGKLILALVSNDKTIRLMCAKTGKVIKDFQVSILQYNIVPAIFNH